MLLEISKQYNMQKLLLISFFICFSQLSFSQDYNKNVSPKYSYSYITVMGKAFSKKLSVEVDLGDTQNEIDMGKSYSEILNNKKSYAAILNYMADKKYELVESRDISTSYQGTGGSYGIILIMRKIDVAKNQ
jgi:hypothetical protein